MNKRPGQQDGNDNLTRVECEYGWSMNPELSQFGRIGRFVSLRHRRFRNDLDFLCATMRVVAGCFGV
jgi:hypothetical protein